MREPLKGRARDDAPAAGGGAPGRPAGRPFVREVSPAFRRVFDDVERAAEPELRVETVPAHDTGIGREAGFANDAELVAAAAADRAALPPAVRELADEVDERVQRAMLEGDAFPTPEDFR